MKIRFRSWMPPLLTLLIFISIWTSSLWLVPWLVESKFIISPCRDKTKSTEECINNREILQLSGSVGDLFGAANSLFSGVALAGVALTLWMQTRDRRREARPLLIPNIGDARQAGGSSNSVPSGTVAVLQPATRDGIVCLPIEVVVPLLNQSSEAALSIRIKGCILGVASEEELEVPIAAQHAQGAKLELTLSGRKAVDFHQSLQDLKKQTELIIEVRYSNLDGVGWKTNVIYLLSLDQTGNGRDGKMLANALNPPLQPALRKDEVSDDLRGIDDAEGAWSNNFRIFLRTKAKARSWSHGEE